jgi:AraC family transcriptional regulator
VSARRIEVIEGGRTVPILAEAPLLASSDIPWEGVLLEEFPARVLETQLLGIRTVLLVFHAGGPVRQEWHIVGGSGNQFQRPVVTPGSIHLLTTGPERSLSHRHPLDCILLSIEPSYFHRALADSPRSERIELIERFAMQDPQIERLVTALHAEAKAGAPTGTLFGQSIATALTVYLAQRYSSSPSTLRSYRGGMPRARLNRVLEYIAANLQEDMSLARLAATAGMNLYYFCRLFKQSTGLSPHRYVLEQRIRRAQQFLRTSDMTILEASARSGFADQGHFTKVFRRFVGITPTEYRAQSGM